MPVSRNSFRRAIADMIHRHSTVKYHQSNEKLNRNSLLSNDSLISFRTNDERLNQCENDIYKLLNYFEQILTHQKYEIIPNVINSLIDNIFDFENIFRMIMESQFEKFRISHLNQVYAALADLIQWSDELILLNRTNNQQYEQLINDFMKSIRNCLSSSSSSSSSNEIRPNSHRTRPVSLSYSILSLSNSNEQENENNQRIQIIFDDINQIIDKYTRELDETLSKTDISGQNSMGNFKTIVDQQNQSEIFLENVSHLLVFNNDDPSLRGGTISALIICATLTDRKDFLYQQAFLTTYRTFISPDELIDRLIQRYLHFFQQKSKKKLARCTFSLLIRVIEEIENEFNENLLKILLDFIRNLIRHGELELSKLLRNKLEMNQKQLKNNDENIIFIQNSISIKRATLIDFHSNDLSEQLTLIDSDLFRKIQLSEILYVSIEKGDQYSPNLTKFIQHFNNISFWVRSRILEQNSQRQRENYFEKFLKMLKHLRRLNNFNSYLAILSALDCGPLKRLHWPKTITDAITEYTELIDSTGSFKNYRQVFNASFGQPCIPYIGLILSDLTFIHIGNSNYLHDQRIINFWKRWQQFTILHKIHCCRKNEYKIVRNDRIIYFFNHFDDYMNEDAQWIQSEKIKPRQKTNSFIVNLQSDI